METALWERAIALTDNREYEKKVGLYLNLLLQSYCQMIKE